MASLILTFGRDCLSLRNWILAFALHVDGRVAVGIPITHHGRATSILCLNLLDRHPQIAGILNRTVGHRALIRKPVNTDKTAKVADLISS